MLLLAIFLLARLTHSPPPNEAAAGKPKALQGQVVLVGKDGLKFQPRTLTATMNEKITFVFFAKNHTVTQTTLENPCTLAADQGFDSGFIGVSPNASEYPTQVLTVMTTKPIYFACVAKKHCELGMVGGINLPPSGAGGIEEFTSKAKLLMQSTAKAAEPGKTTETSKEKKAP